MHTSERMFNYLHNYTSFYFKVNTGYYTREEESIVVQQWTCQQSTSYVIMLALAGTQEVLNTSNCVG